MYKQKKDKKEKQIKILIIMLFATLLIFSLYFNNRKIIFLEDGFKGISNSIDELLLKPIRLYNVEKDVDQSESYLIQKNVNESLEKEIEELKDALELNRTITEYNTVNATILSRNKSYWFNTLTIDKGKKDGIKKEMAVITKKGLIGKISKVYSSSSEIKLITSEDVNNKISVAIKTGNSETIAILNGYDTEKNLVKVVGVNKNANVEVGNEVLTSGLGGVFPKGIYIGTIEKIESDKYDLSNNIYIKTNQDFNNIHYVTVLTDK